MQFEVGEDDAGKRLDLFLVENIPDTSRARIQEWIKAGRVEVNQSTARPSRRLEAGESVAVDPAPAKPLHAFAEEIPLDILYEDDDLAAINKPAGMTVHAGAGVVDGTLVNALLHHLGSLSGVGGELRPGIVHRIDRFTSGVLLVAKTDLAHRRLARLFESRKVQKTYWAVVEGRVSETELAAGRLASRGIHPKRVEVDGHWWVRLEMPIRRDPRHRIRMTAKVRPEFVRHPADRIPEESEAAGRSARTDFRVLKNWKAHSLLEVRIATGRTHQIRVHLSAIGHSVVGDRLYGAAAPRPGSILMELGEQRRPELKRESAKDLTPAAAGAPENRGPKPDAIDDPSGSSTRPADDASKRFFLHARHIKLAHPTTHKTLSIEAPLPPDFERLIAALEV